jgi:tape measure domain-containing protein
MPSTDGIGSAVNKLFNGIGGSAGNKFSMGFLQSGIAGAVGGAVSSFVTKGIDAIMRNLDAGISRYDTIQNFPNVMSNFGIANDAAAAAIKKISDGLQGLPTSLDAGASAVQRFTSVTGDVDKATDYFLALNNAVLAGGAPMEVQSTALEQLSQSFAKGKPDMMEWRSAMTAMPAQLGQVAKSMGLVSADELGEQLRNGTISMDDFMQEITKLNTEGVEGFQNFADQAKNATGGIGTGMANVQTAIKRGIANIIGSLEAGVKDASGVGFGDIFSGIAKGIDAAFSFVGDIVGRVFETIEKFSQSEAGQRMAETFNKLKESFSGMDARPVILTVIEKIVEIFAGVGASVLEIINGIREGIEKFANSTAGQALHDTFQRIGEQFASISGGEGPTLVGFLEGLEKVFSVIAQGVGYAILGIATAIEKIIGFIKNAITITGMVVTVVIDVVKKIISVVTGIVDFFKNLPENVKNLVAKIGTFFMELPGKIWDGLVAAVTRLGEWVVEMATKANDTRTEIIDKIVNFFKELPYNIGHAIGEALRTFARWIVDMATQAIEVGPQVIMAIGTFFAELPGKIGEALLLAITSFAKWIVDMATQSAEISIKVIGAIGTFFAELPGKIGDALLLAITSFAKWIVDLALKAAEVGPQVIEKIRGFFAELPGKVLNAISNLWDTIKQIFLDIPGKVLDAIADIFNVGKSLVEGLWNGITAMGSWLLDQIKGFASGIIEGFRSAFRVNSPSKVLYAIGKFLPMGLGNAITDGIGYVLGGVGEMGDAVIDAFADINKGIPALGADIVGTVDLRGGAAKYNAADAGLLSADGSDSDDLIAYLITLIESLIRALKSIHIEADKREVGRLVMDLL